MSASQMKLVSFRTSLQTAKGEGLNNSPLFIGEKIFLTPPDPDNDAVVEAQWSQDPAYLALLQGEPVRPLSPQQILRKKRAASPDANQFAYAIRLLETGRLIGLMEIKQIWWTHRAGWIRIQIGNAADRSQGYGSDALALLLRYAFYELNLDRLIASVYEYNVAAQHFFEKAGFTIEVRQREVYQRFGRRWDLLMMGLTIQQWEEMQQKQPEGQDDSQ